MGIGKSPPRSVHQSLTEVDDDFEVEDDLELDDNVDFGLPEEVELKHLLGKVLLSYPVSAVFATKLYVSRTPTNPNATHRQHPILS